MRQFTNINESGSNSLREVGAACGATQVRLIEKYGEYVLYEDQNGTRYINDGADTYSELSDDFSQIYDAVFGEGKREG